MEPEFAISSDECRLILLLDETGSIKGAAGKLRRDISVVSRQVARIAEKTGLLEKIDGRWQVSEAGKRLNSWSRDAIQSQRQALSARSTLRISTTREFAARVLGPALPKLLGKGEETLVSVIVSDEGVEKSLLLGEADLGLDCGRPRDPLIRFQRITPEPFVIAAAPAIAARVRDRKALLDSFHLQYQRMSSARLLGLSQEIPLVAASFNDLGAMRSACEAGMGWGIFPRYAVKAELARKTLREIRIPAARIEPEQFGVWWLRERKSLEPWVQAFCAWLRTQSL